MSKYEQMGMASSSSSSQVLIGAKSNRSARTGFILCVGVCSYSDHIQIPDLDCDLHYWIVMLGGLLCYWQRHPLYQLFSSCLFVHYCMIAVAAAPTITTTTTTTTTTTATTTTTTTVTTT